MESRNARSAVCHMERLLYMVCAHCGATTFVRCMRDRLGGLGSKHIKDVMVPPQWTPQFHFFFSCAKMGCIFSCLAGIFACIGDCIMGIIGAIADCLECIIGGTPFPHWRYAMTPGHFLMRGTQRSLDVSRESWTAYVTASVVGKLSCGPGATAVPAKSNGFLKHETVYLGAPEPPLDNRGLPQAPRRNALAFMEAKPRKLHITYDFDNNP